MSFYVQLRCFVRFLLGLVDRQRGNAEHIYYPLPMGGGVKRLFRKVRCNRARPLASARNDSGNTRYHRKTNNLCRFHEKKW